MQSEKILGIFGLTNYEEKTYLALIRLGSSRASNLAKEANIARQKIYEVLENLDKKGFVNIIDGKVKTYSAISPVLIEKLLVDKFENAKTFLGNLQKSFTSSQKEKTWVVKDKRKIDSILYQIVKTLQVKNYIYIAANDLIILSHLIKEITHLKKRSVDVKIIASNDEQTRLRAKAFQKNKIPIKFVDPKYLSGLGGVYDDKIGTIFEEETMILSESKSLINFVKNHFNLLWNIS